MVESRTFVFRALNSPDGTFAFPKAITIRSASAAETTVSLIFKELDSNSEPLPAATRALALAIEIVASLK